MSEAAGTAWLSAVPGLAGLDPAGAVLLDRLSLPLRAGQGSVLFRDGAPCEAFLILLDGSIRVQKTGENGREIALYRVGAGQTCVVTTVCLMSGRDYDAEAIAETDLHGRVIPAAAFRRLLAESAVFRDFVFRAFGTVITDLLLLIEEVSFGRIDQRLAACLLARAQAGAVQATHQELAAELGSAREVISRQLKEFESRAWLALARGRIELRDAAALADLARK